MKLLTLTINNFLSFESAKLSLDNKGLVAVQGANLDGNGADSNGSGKSSLFIAIRWGLYGNTDKNISSDEVVNDKAGKNCTVETVWLDELTDIQYRITRYRKHTKNKNKLTFEVKHPGGDWKNETLGKNDLTQALVNQAIGMDDTVFMAACFASQEDPIDIPAMKDSELKRLLETSLPFAKIDPLHQKYKAMLDSLFVIKSKHERNKADSEHSFKINMDLLVKTTSEQKAYIAGQNAAIASAKEKIAKLKHDIETLLSGLPDIPRLNAQIAALQDKHKTLGVSQGMGLQMRLRGLFERQMDLDSKDPSKCPTCGGEWGSAHELMQYHQKKSDVSLEINTVKAELDKVKKNEPLAKKIEEKVAELNGLVNKAAKDNMHVSSLRRELTAEEASLARLMSDDPFVNTLKTLHENTARDGTRVAEADKELAAILPEITVYTNLVEVTSPKGFRYHMLESITPDLNRATNYYLSMLTDGKIGAVWSTVKRLGSGEYREAFSIKVNMNGRTSFGALSGGQKRKVRLACWFALQDLIAERAEKDVKLWVCDEVDGALDKAGIERLMSLLEEKARTKETVLVISHNSMKDWIANSITVSMEGDVSKVSGFMNVI